MKMSDLNKFLGFINDHDKEINEYGINLKLYQSKQFRVGFEFLEDENFNIEVSLNQFESIRESSYFDTYFESTKLNKFFKQMLGTDYLYYFALLHEIGHILHYMICDFETFKNTNSYTLTGHNYSYERFVEYRKSNAEQIADNYAIDFIDRNLDDIIKFVLNIDSEELEMWKMLTV